MDEPAEGIRIHGFEGSFPNGQGADFCMYSKLRWRFRITILGDGGGRRRGEPVNARPTLLTGGKRRDRDGGKLQ